MAYKAATDLVFKGQAQPSGYTEPLVHAWRLKVKAGWCQAGLDPALKRATLLIATRACVH
jgi:hypothetical protein